MKSTWPAVNAIDEDVCVYQKSKFWQLCDNDWSLCTDLDDCQIIQAEIRVIVLVWNNADDLIYRRSYGSVLEMRDNCPTTTETCDGDKLLDIDKYLSGN